MNVRPNFHHIEQVSAELREILGDDFDRETFLETLDGETDTLDLIDALLEQRVEMEAHAEASKAAAEKYAARAKRLASSADAVKAAMGRILAATGERKVKRPLGTVSIQQGRMSAHIVDEHAIPTQLCKVTRTPDKAAIKKQLDAGEGVPGAELVRGADIISVRVG